MKNYRQMGLLALLLGLLLLGGAGPVAAALGWVGGMFPAGGSTTEIQQGTVSSFDVYVQVYKAGVTPGVGQGPGIQCYVHWGPLGGTWADTAMAYHQDQGNNDEYKGTLAIGALPVGTYGFTAYCTDGTPTWQGAGDGFIHIWNPDQPDDAQAIWLDEITLAWMGPAASTYRLYYDPDGGLSLSSSSFITLTVDGTVSGYPAFPNATGKPALRFNGGAVGLIPTLLQGQLVVAAYNSGGALVKATGVQLQGVLDDLYRYAGPLGVTYEGPTPTLRLWAPTAKSVTLHRFTDATTPLSTTEAMTAVGNGVWAITGAPAWDKQYYLYEVEVYVPGTGRVERNLVTDPYAVNLTQNGRRSQLLDLANDPTLKPAGWDTLTKPSLAAPEDVVVYEVHVRDFSIQDTSVLTPDRGTFRAFTYDGRDGRPLSNGMRHLQTLAAAGLTHIHLLPAFDIASVEENPAARSEPDPALLATYPPSSTLQQEAINATRHLDGFNWGYDPVHYGVPEGSYATAQDDTTRVREFRELVQRLNENGLRVVMDMVYNHTAASGQSSPFSVLDKIVPGYYYRYDGNGRLQNSSCCSDTGAEFAMMQKLMVDTVVRWARDYKVDGFRFDLMNLHTVDNMLAVKAAVRALTLTTDGVDGSQIYLYGEGWDFGSAAAKGLTYAKQGNMAGTGIGTFNDKLRDAAHGGYSTDPLQIRHQGFINGLSYDWNGYFYDNRDLANLKYEMDRLRVGLAGELRTFQFKDSAGANKQGSDYGGYALDPQEVVNYVEKHDNETLYDNNIFKAPAGTSLADRVRIQNLGLSLTGLAQGVPFFQMGSDMLRSKSLDRNSYDSGDWFNRVDFTYQRNNFGVGLPPAWDNQSRWSIMEPLLANAALQPGQTEILSSVHHLSETLRIRQSSPLFRLRTAADINRRVKFYATGDAPIIVMELTDIITPDLDAQYERILVFFNAGKTVQPFTISAYTGNTHIQLHPIQQNAYDPVVRTASFNSSNGTFTIPPRTTAVFVDTSPNITTSATPPTWVGNLWPAGGSSTPRQAGDGSGLTVYVQAYKVGVTGSANGSNGSAHECYLHWGRYGSAWGDLPMAFNAQFTGNSNNDEYYATLPTGELAVGTYGFTAYCTGAGNPTSREWNAGSDGILSITPRPAESRLPSNPHGVYVHLFEWSWDDIAKECPYLAQQGYTAVQISPPMEHITATEWWARYQPVSYRLDQSRSGTLAQFQQMITACTTAGVEIYADAVINHMTAMSGTGTAGSVFTKYDYPTVPYTMSHFHTPCDINSYTDRWQVQHCQLLGLADLDYDNADTRAKILAYLEQLQIWGVKGFRIDGAKHMAAYDLERVLSRLGGAPYIFQEVIEDAAEPIQGYEYLYNGAINDFNYEYGLAYAFKGGGNLASLKTFGTGAEFVPSAFAAVFTNNHDDQRTRPAQAITYKDATHDLANVFMLAWPYGYPQVMSSYYFSDPDQGPPALSVYNGNEPTPSRCADGTHWVCEHRRTPIANMVRFRHVVGEAPVIYWWDNGANQIAFGRGYQGYVAINREGSALVRTFQTGLAPGRYCNVIQGTLTPDGLGCTGEVITVTASGQIVNYTLPALSAFAIHSGARLLQPADLVLTKQVTPGAAHWGEPLTYTLVLTNLGPGPAFSPILTDLLPALLNVQVASSGVTLTPTGSSAYVWQMGDLPVDAVGRITITGLISPGTPLSQTLTNLATLSAANDPLTGNNASTADLFVLNWPPTLTVPADQTVPQNSVVGPLTVTVGDLETPAAALTLTAASGNPALIPETALALGGSGPTRTLTLTLTASLTGTARLTLTVADGWDTTSAAFTVTVTATATPKWYIYLPLVLKNAGVVGQGALIAPHQPVLPFTRVVLRIDNPGR